MSSAGAVPDAAPRTTRLLTRTETSAARPVVRNQAANPSRTNTGVALTRLRGSNEAVASGAELEPGWGDLAIGLGEDHGVDRAAEDSEGSAVREQQPLVLPDR